MGLLLNERAIYQLESLECREKLQQLYQSMGFLDDFEDNNGDGDKSEKESNNDSSFDEHNFYVQELEAQVQYWKKEAKKYQHYRDGYKEQCQKDLALLLETT